MLHVTPTVGAGLDPELLAAYGDCVQIARTEARNFYYAFQLLPRGDRLATCALYAFFHRTDDVGDSDEPLSIRRQRLEEWRQALAEVLAGGSGPERWWDAFADVVRRREIPMEHLSAVVAGVASDLDVDRYPQFTDLYHYCYNVASAVGLCCVRAWGACDPRADVPAEWLGIAFQLTNIIRDVVEDFDRGRIYLPTEDLERFGVTELTFENREPSPEFEALMRYEIARAHDYYERSAPLRAYLPPSGRAILEALTRLYRGLLRKIEQEPAAVLRGRVSLSRFRKWAAVAQAAPRRFFG